MMTATRSDIIVQLQRDILSLECCKKQNTDVQDVGLGPIKNAFPNHTFPLGAVHEFYSAKAEDSAATGGFISGILSSLMSRGGVCIWISALRTIFPPALQSFGVAADKVIFINLTKEKEILWATEEALKCEGLAAVVAEIQELSFMASRRLQLATEQSGVTGFMLRHHPRSMNITACVTRWSITHLPGELPVGMPGVGFPRWNVALLKVRNGKPGNWTVEFKDGRFRHPSKIAAITQQEKKTG
jgi:protein ImuA